MHVLLVEDDDTTAMLLQQVLETEEGWEVTRVATLEGARDVLVGDERASIEAVVLDHVLPDGTGLELLVEVSQEEAMVPMVYLTGEGDEEVAFRALSQGAVDYLVKGEDPVPQELPDRLARAVAHWSGVGALELMDPSEDHDEDGSDGGRTGSAGPRAPAPGGTPRSAARIEQDYDDLDDLLEAMAAEDCAGCAVYDGRGALLIADLPEEAKEGSIGTLSVDVSRHVSALSLAAGRTPRRHFLIVDTHNGILGSSIVPGPLIFVMLFPLEVEHEEALHRLKRTARRVWSAGGSDPGGQGAGS